MRTPRETITQHFRTEKEQTIAKCKQCGVCAKKCPIIPHTHLAGKPPKDIQKEIYRYLQDGDPNDTTYTRAFACMACFQCVDACCPEGLNPFLINEIIKSEYSRQGFTDFEPTDPANYGDEHRILAGTQVTPEEWSRISTPTPPGRAQYVFYPGCKAYFQPDKILSSLDILDLMKTDYAFVPGLDYCCGDEFIYEGNITQAEIFFDSLVNQLASYSPETVIFWCPTCACRFQKTFAPIREIPFSIMTLPQFLNQNITNLNFEKSLPFKFTLHDACKTVFTGLDSTGPRQTLQAIPDLELVEMPRHGKHTSCCGSGAADFFPESMAAVRDQRLQEAADTEADLLVDVCHYCHYQFVAREPAYPFTVVNYISLVAKALGIAREDKYRKYRISGDVEGIIAEAEAYIAMSPYPRTLIESVVQKYFALEEDLD